MSAVLTHHPLVDPRFERVDVPGRRDERLGSIDALRGVAILLVFFFHGWDYSNCPAAYWWNPLRSGYTGVHLFLLISGFCLYWPRVKGGVYRPISLKRFAVQRARRILPPYYAAVILFVLLGTTLPRGVASAAGLETSRAAAFVAASWHLALVHNLNPSQLWTVAAPLWSLGLEAHLYVAMPLLVAVASKFSASWAAALTAIVTLSSRMFLVWYAGGNSAWASLDVGHQAALASFFLARCLEFGLGLWAAELFARGVPQRSGIPFLPFAIVCFVVAAAFARQDSASGLLYDTLFGFAYFFLLLAALKIARVNDESRSEANVLKLKNRRAAQLMAKILRWRPLALLGGVSYSVYLVHDPILRIGLHCFVWGHGLRDRYIFGIIALILFPVVLIVSVGFHFVFERPFMRLPPQNPVLSHAPVCD